MSKVIKIIGIILIEVLIMFIFLKLGMNLHNSTQTQELLTINKIALVNLDDGVDVEGMQKYYGTEFINELDDNFEITSLEQARRGLENDLYAAYVIIPATFSKNIESINSDPIKSNITYKLNPNLEYDIREEVITDIWKFNNSLSTNIEYVYVDAILKGVHAVQDGGDELLANDLKDLQAVLQFTEIDLIVDPEYPDEKHVDNNIKDLDVSDIYASMQTVFSDLSTEYKSTQTNAQKEYDKLKDDMVQVSTKMNELNTKIGDVAKIDEGEEFDIENDEQIDSYINAYNTNITQWKMQYDSQITGNFDSYIDECQTHTNKELETRKENHKKHLKDYYETAFTVCNDESISDDTEQGDSDENLISRLEVYDLALSIINEVESENAELKRINSELKDEITTLEKELGNMQGGGDFIESSNVKRTKQNAKSDTEKIDESTGATPEEPTNQEMLYAAIENDINTIKREEQKEHNKMLKNTITTWLKKDLEYYSATTEDIEELDPDEMNAEKVEELFDNWYDTKVELSIEPTDEEDSTEDETTVEETTQGNATETTENASDNEENDSGEDEESEETDEDEKTEDELRLEKRAKVLFDGTDEPSLLDAETLDGLISGVVITPISGSIMKKYSELTTSYTALNTVLTNWNTKLGAFTIDSYGNDEKRNAIEKTFNGNLKKIESEVNNKSKEYEMYVTQANKANTDNLDAWKTSIQNANEKTRNNIDHSIKNIKNTREQMNTSNNNLISNISNVLPYSRIGELENRNVYSYITSPIVQEDLSEGNLVKNKETKDNETEITASDNKDELIILVLIAVMCVSGGIILFRQMNRRNK